MKKFFGVIGNPPYQDQTVGTQKNYGAPIYDKFLDSSFEVSEKVELVHPARFLFDAGGTSKNWNRKMLADEHFSILHYAPDGKKMFPSAEIKGGIAISYRDAGRTIGPIGVFIPDEELRSIHEKTVKAANDANVAQIMCNRGECHISETFQKDYPDWREQVGDTRFMPAMFSRFPDAFFDEEPDDEHEYTYMLGLIRNKRFWKYVRRDYIRDTSNRIDSYKVFMPNANGNGVFGETISGPLVSGPGTAPTESFVSAGPFDSEEDAGRFLKYLKTKFFRALLGIMKKTHHNPAKVFTCIPLQDFTSISDIDWSKPIAEIDQQLYAKYGLDADEIEFIESHVKEMS